MTEARTGDGYLAECFWSGVSRRELTDLDGRARASALVTRGTTEEVRYRGSVLVPVDEVVLCFFTGPSQRAVESVARRAGIPFSRIVASVAVSQLGVGQEAS